MGGSVSKSKGYWPFAGQSSADDPSKETHEQPLARLSSFRNATPFVFTRRSSLYFDEDGDLAHEFYEETVVTKNGRKRAKLKRIQKDLIPQGVIQLEHPCIHVDVPVVLCEVWWSLECISRLDSAYYRTPSTSTKAGISVPVKTHHGLLKILLSLHGEAVRKCITPLHVDCKRCGFCAVGRW